MKYTLKRLLALFLCASILLPATGVFAQGVESPKNLALALTQSESGNYDAFTLSWINPDWVKKQLASGKTVAFEIDSSVNQNPWSSTKGQSFKGKLTAKDKDRAEVKLSGAQFSNLANPALESNLYSFRVRYIGAGESGYTNAVSVGYRPVFNNSSNWSVEELRDAGKNGLIPPSVKADMKKDITREEFTEVMVRLYEKVERVHLVAGKSPFKDTKNESVVIASRLGLVNGVGNGKFAPNAKITREDMATILARFIKSVGVKENATSGAPFGDHNKISPYARESVYTLRSMGLMDGYQDNAFRPKTHASREQAMVLAQRIYTTIAK
ncbi:S-layer homology domain-containing protein [Peptoniphilus sp. HCN-40583]|uniref:S-layer homology domain-containing protein n=1 Tax=Peptoniphilus sp. HCN-40583 TaxID=3134662 RepID=UPI0030BB3993